MPIPTTAPTITVDPVPDGTTAAAPVGVPVQPVPLADGNYEDGVTLDHDGPIAPNCLLALRVLLPSLLSLLGTARHGIWSSPGAMGLGRSGGPRIDIQGQVI